MKQKRRFSVVIVLAVSLVFALGLVFGFFSEADYLIYDLLLHVRPKLAQDESIVFLEVDDTAIDYVGVWPWSRHIMADGLFLLKELGAERVVFDIEYVQSSPRGVNQTVLTEDIPEVLDRDFVTMNSNVRDLVTAISQGYIKASEAGDYLDQLEDLSGDIKAGIQREIMSISRDNDRYLGEGAHFFQKAFFTVTMIPDAAVNLDPEYLKWVAKEKSYSRVSGDLRSVPEFPGIMPAIAPVLEGAAGAGFPNIIIDSDGVRRRIHLFSRYGDQVFPQLVIRPLLDTMGDPEVVFSKKAITINTGEDTGPVVIPLNPDGTVSINWTGTVFSESFRHVSYYLLALYQNQEQELVHNLKLMNADEYFSYYEGEALPLEVWNYLETIKVEMSTGLRPYDREYADGKEYFLELVGDFLSGPTEAKITSIIDEIVGSSEYTQDEKAEYLRIREEVAVNFASVKELYDDLADTRARIRASVADSFVIVGATATSTTDWGVNPFEKNFPNVGTHGAVLNMVLNRDFIREAPPWYALAAAVALVLFLAFVLPRLNPVPGVLLGLGIIIVFAGIVSGGLLVFDTYFQSAGSLMLVLTGFIALFIAKLIATGREKAFIHQAFNHYLSVDVINEILKDPQKLSLGGEKKYITAMFTDVRGFSTISEKMDPTDLVRLLNTYLSEMSDIILEVKGTIDKYEGDAIISFFGAPVAIPDHARRACLAAVRMAAVESELNVRFIEDGILTSPLYTRIGINTGDMVVGNMGTASRMDYTIMGNSVNLAARLEGVNKQYDSRILISEMTRSELDDVFLLRRLDKVRVVGIHTPVRLYEVLAESRSAGDKALEMVAAFQKGLDLFEEKRWKESAKVFSACLELASDDGPSAVYLRRCREYIKTPPPESWDGVFNLSVK
ncbi:MAG: adenylate/guanylate cyclase domain-containing protein [Spirochaetales bacterium]|nr:adenylate/guanylate cyclase domain-containing protein [Spirochaetales bacterium]